MSILILNLSPCRLGTSTLLGRPMQEQPGEQARLRGHPDIRAAWGSFLEAAGLADTRIFITLRYVNAILGDAIKVLAKLHQTGLSRGKYVYVIAQGGMSYTRTHHYCTSSTELFAKAIQLRCMGGSVIRGETIIDGVTLKHLSNAVLVEHCLQKLIACTQHKMKVDSLLLKQAEIKIPGFVARPTRLKTSHTIHKQ